MLKNFSFCLLFLVLSSLKAFPSDPTVFLDRLKDTSLKEIEQFLEELEKNTAEEINFVTDEMKAINLEEFEALLKVFHL